MKNYSNRILSGSTAKQETTGHFYITAIIGKGSGQVKSIQFDALTDLTLKDNETYVFHWPIITKDFTVTDNDLQVVYYEEQ